MGRTTWISRAALAITAAACSLTAPAFAAEPFNNDELVAGSEFLALPDKNTHSGVFLDLIALGSSSVTSPNGYGIAVPADRPSLRVAIFDGNAGGLWDQNRIENDAGGNPIPDGSVVEYDLVTASPTAPETVVAIADSESATPRAGATIFTYAVDGRWQFLYDGPHHPNALLPDGRHVYSLHVKYRQPTPSGGKLAPINGYKVAVNAPFGLIPLQVGQLLTGGFIGGVVDSRNMLFNFPGSPAVGAEYSVSRDHYPDLLEPSATLNSILNGPVAALPAVRFPSPDPFVNTYAGTFELGINLVPSPGQSWVTFLSNLILEEGDADDVDDLSGIGSDGMPSPSNAGIPPDDGRAYVDSIGVAHDNSGYRLPFAAQPSDAGSPWLELVDPNGVVRVTLLDLSGNVSPDNDTSNGFEKIPVPLDGIPGLWKVRINNLDARNSWFLRANAEFNPLSQSLEGRVYRDLNCDGDDELDTEPALSNLTVRIQRTDVAAAPIFRVTDANGFWSVNPIDAGTYAISVDSDVPNLTSAIVQPLSKTVAPSANLKDADIGYCEKTCDCGETGRLHEVCFEASVWLADPTTTSFDVYVRLDKGCECDPPMVDLACLAYDGPFPGEQSGRNGVLKIKDLKVVDGYAKVLVCATADPAWFPMGYFDGTMKLTVVVNCVGEAACGEFSCKSLKIGGTFPADWRPLWCDDAPDFFLKSYLAWECWPDKPCTDGCVKGLAWWKAVHKYGTCDATKIAWPIDGGEDKLLCGKTWLKILRASAKCDSWTALAQQWVVAKLNAAGGACTPKAVEAALEEAAALLGQNCAGLCGLAEERARIVYLVLKGYNDGKAGPGACTVKVPCCPPPPPKCPPPPPPTCEPKPKGNNGVGNGLDPQPPGNPPVNDGPGTSPGNPGNKGGKGAKDNQSDKGSKGDKGDKGGKPSGDESPTCDDPPKDRRDDKPKGNNGVGNGLDPQPPGNPPVNDGPGTAPGKPGNKGGKK